MGSIAMDGAGNMALGYSVSSSSVFPSIRYTGRQSDDTLGTMPESEVTLKNGSGSQTWTSRWGDYSAMSVDPTDDCTFWYTQQYMPASGLWATHVGSFSFDSCTSDGPFIFDSADFNGDGISDLTVFRPSTGQWWRLGMPPGQGVVKFGQPGDIPVPGDYNGDNITQIAVFRPSTGQWWRLGMPPGQGVVKFGQPGDIPIFE
jgi:hypothetical protein